MPTTVPIKVFRIGHTVVDQDEIQRWLDHIGANEFEIPDDAEITNPALLIALAGKRCYMSFQPGLNPNVTQIRKEYVDYFDNILKSGHGCYDAETDVLTSEGWVAWPEVTSEMRLATRRSDGQIEYHRPTHLLAEQYQGRMYRVDSQGVDLFVTPNHNMYVVPTSTKRGRQRLDADYSLIRADKLNRQSHAYVKTGEWQHADDLSADVLALLGFAIGDANVDNGGRRLRFHLRRERKILWLYRQADRLGWELQHTDGTDYYSVIVPEEPRLRRLFADIYAADLHKQVPRGLLLSQSRRGLLGLLEGLLQPGGHDGETGDSFDTTSPYLVDQMQQLCLHVGLAANICYEYGPERRTSAFGDKPLTRLSIIRRNLRPEVNRYVGQVGRSSWIESWEGMVYCAQVPNNTLYVRRNGIPVWCGNSVLEHSVYNFAIEGVSRVFCYAPDTEVLTNTGWKPVREVASGELVLTKDPATGRARWSVNHETHQFEYSGPVHYWESSEERSPTVTPEHTLWAADMYRRRTRGISAEEAADRFSEKITYRELAGKMFTVDHRIGAIQNDVDDGQFTIGGHSYDAEQLAEWLGFVATDGNVCPVSSRRNRLRIYQIKDGSRIRQLMDSLFADRWKYNNRAEPSFDISDPDLYQWALLHLGPTKDLRDLRRLFRWSPRLVTAFLKGAEGGDGSTNSTDHQYLHCSLPRPAGQYQVLYAKIGNASRVVQREQTEPHELPNGQTIVATRPTTTLSVNKKGVSQCQPYMQRVLHFNGIVACPRTDDGIVYVRHADGRAMWCGNTAEMNRHRAGWAISEGSLRFIRFGDNIPYWEPDSISGAATIDDAEDIACGMIIDGALTAYKEAHKEKLQEVLVDLTDDDRLAVRKQLSREIFKIAFSEQEQAYRALESIWADELSPTSKFSGKKQITSMMRRIIGLGVATGGVWSGNIRALRHVFAMRAAAVAEEEMIHVFSRVVQVMVEKEPLLFGDFTTDADGFWRPKYAKV